MIGDFLIALLIGSIISVPLRLYVRASERALANRVFFRNKFYDLANRVSSHPEIDQSELARIGRLLALLDDPRGYWKLWSAARELERKIKSGKYQDADTSRFKDPDLALSRLEMTYCGWVSISYSKPILGIALRGALATVFDPTASVGNAEIVARHLHSPDMAHA